ncbi:Ribonuclease BN [Candidatus Burkholderia humilis]|nr:Ribonuclease BN [Candidatus Burkholderia humilis]
MSKILGPMLGPHVESVARDPLGFVARVIKAFRANQGMLLAGAVAYYALLSIVPLLILIVIVLSKFIGQQELLDTLAHLLEWLVPGQARAIVRELANFLTHRAVIGWLLLVTMIFFSSLAFTVLENAMSVIFVHRVAMLSFVPITLGAFVGHDTLARCCGALLIAWGVWRAWRGHRGKPTVGMRTGLAGLALLVLRDVERTPRGSHARACALAAVYRKR